ncbi:hypothetical protein [Nocardia sp. NPDC004711]
MSVEGVLALLNGDRPAGWLQYLDGSWAPVGHDGWIGPPITAADLLEVASHDLAALEAAGFIGEVIDVEPLAVVDVEHGDSKGGRTTRLALRASRPPDPAEHISIAVVSPRRPYRGTPKMSDDHELSPGSFDEAAQQNPAWIDWKQPDQIAARVEALFAETVPTWTDEKPPDVERYSHDMIDWLCAEVFEEIFRDVDALEAPDNAQAAGQFVTYFGEALCCLAGGEWFAGYSAAGNYSTLFEMKFTPTVGYRWGNTLEWAYSAGDDLTDLIYQAVESDDTDSQLIADLIYRRDVDHKRAMGIPDEFDQANRQHDAQ